MRLAKILRESEEIPFGNRDSFIILSDCHRGDNSAADDFAQNHTLFLFVLDHYFGKGFTYIELGDGDELWENKNFEHVQAAHNRVFLAMRGFYRANRLYLIYGNHDVERRNPQTVRKTMSSIYNLRTDRTEPLFPDVQVRAGLVLRHEPTGGRILLTHGHQADPVSDRLWKLSRFFVRYWWRHLQMIGFHDPTSPAQNVKRRDKAEERLIAWVLDSRTPLMVGHTHQPRFPAPGKPAYFNTGSCVHPRCVTGLEISGGRIGLIKWSMEADRTGRLFFKKRQIEGPHSLESVFLEDQDSPAARWRRT
jgi:UDP-2,3-diacylglucosamine pyrophosphatase LpxH